MLKIAWVGFDADICRAIAVAVFGDVDAIDYVVVDGRTRFEFLIDGTIDVLSCNNLHFYTKCRKEIRVSTNNLL